MIYAATYDRLAAVECWVVDGPEVRVGDMQVFLSDVYRVVAVRAYRPTDDTLRAWLGDDARVADWAGGVGITLAGAASGSQYLILPRPGEPAPTARWHADRAVSTYVAGRGEVR